MLIGFASEAASSNKQADDSEILQEIGCERILSAAEGVFVVEDALQYLRPGDVLAVVELSRLGSDLDRVIRVLEQIHLAEVRIRVTSPAIVPGTTLGDSFSSVCCVLAEFSRSHSQRHSGRPRTPGRPNALPPEAQVRAERMIKGGRLSVTEIARVLGVSAATVYRYFPRRREALKIETKHKASHKPRENPKPSSKI
jgi:DNA invertase Pin-like site-specific DNA recombinase